MTNNKHNFENDEEQLDLSRAIQNYSQDNELRRKINEMKKQKEAGSTKAKDDDFFHVINSNSPIFTGSTNEDHIDAQENNKIPDIRIDAEFEKTRVGFQDESDKTLVIMNRKTPIETYSTDTQSFEPDELNDDTFDDIPVAMEVPITHEYESEVLDEEEEQNKPEKSQKSIDKMNKIIMYGIIGIIVVAVLVGAVFGIRALMGGSSDKEDKPIEPPVTDKPVVKDPVVDPSDKEEPDISDNSAEIARLKGERESLEGQLRTAKMNIKNAQTAYDDAKMQLNTYEKEGTRLSQASKDAGVTNGQESLDIILKAYTDKQKELDANPDDADLKAKVLELKTKYTKAERAFQNLSSYNAEYPKVRKELQDAINKADKKKSELNETKKNLEDQIAKINTKLNEYE